jgi:uncharacterized membrane protein YcaP (DUF421 family)
MLMANLASIPMENDGIPLYAGLFPILTVLGLELVLSVLSYASIKFRRVLCGKPVILIENGKILQENLRRTRITPDELTGHLRLKEVLELGTVQYAILETNGELSVFLYPPHRPATAGEAGISPPTQSLPVTVVEDGRLLGKNLTYAHKTPAWVRKTLKSRKATVKTTFLLTVDGEGKEQFIPKEGKP